MCCRLDATELRLTLGRPHAAFFVPHIIGFPDLYADREITPGFGDEGPFLGMRNFDPGHDIDFSRDSFVDQDVVSNLHGDTIFVPSLHGT